MINTYDSSDGRIATQTLPNGAYYTFSYSGSSYTADNGSSGGGTTTVNIYPQGSGLVSDPSNAYSYYYGVLQQEAVTGPSGTVTLTFQIDPVTLLSEK